MTRMKITSPQPAAVTLFTEAVKPHVHGAKHRSDLLKITTTPRREKVGAAGSL